MLSPSLQLKVLKACERSEELTHLLSGQDVVNNPELLQKYSKEFASLDLLVQTQKAIEALDLELKMNQELASDPEFKDMIFQESQRINSEKSVLFSDLKKFLVPTDPLDQQECYLEIRAGTGGQEACLFAGDLLRMYLRFCDRQRWKPEILSANESDTGGYKEVIVKIPGKHSFGMLKFESGGHRVQRVPLTESQGRIHTSACTVAVLPEYDEVMEYAIDPSDLKIDTYRASGAGGQHVNKTDSAIRITHIPTGTVVECQEDRSQHKNRSKAMSLLKSRLLQTEQDKQRTERSSLRQNLVGSGDRSERIRTYNFPQGRLTEHRINLTIYQLDQILDGAIDPIIDALRHEYQASLLLDLESGLL